MKVSSRIIARVALCTAMVALCPHVQSARTSRTSLLNWAPKTNAILCQPGFVYKCTSKGCFCVRP